MAIDRKHVGKRYGPFRYEVGAQKIREFALAIAGGVPSASFGEIPAELCPLYHDAEAARRERHEGVVAPPSFANVFAILPFGRAALDPELGINVMMLVHGEQAFEWHRPVVAGDVVTTEGTITDIYEKSGKDFLVVTAESKNQRGELCVRSVWTAVIRPG